MAEQSATGWKRKKQTHWSVKAADVVSRLLITTGGIGTILAVSMVCIFLVVVVVPLWRGASVGEMASQPVAAKHLGLPVRSAIDEYGLLGWTLYPDGMLRVFRLFDGSLVKEIPLFPEKVPTAFAFPVDANGMAVGFADGQVAFGKILFRPKFKDASDVDDALRSLAVGETAATPEGMVQRISLSQFRFQELTTSISVPLPSESSQPVHRLDYLATGDAEIIAVLHTDGQLFIEHLRQRKNLMTGKISYDKRVGTVAEGERDRKGVLPRYLLMSGLGDSLLLAWADGTAIRYDIRDISATRQLETMDLVENPACTLNALTYLLGRTTILAGDSSGLVRAWFPARPDGDTGQVPKLVTAHEFVGPGGSVVGISSSSRMRMIAVSYESGDIRLFHVTSGKILGNVHAGQTGSTVHNLAFAPKDDGLLAVTKDVLVYWKMDPVHPEITMASLFAPVWYEGSSKPEHVWQSSSGTDDFEPKYGLLPLVFGTIKATIFSMLFGLPIALFGAIFTSEFLRPSVKARVKPVVEMMASLPSVVLGFLAALVFAPIVADYLAVFLSLFVTIPLSFIVGAYLWQLLPRGWSLRFQPHRFKFMFLALPLGLGGGLLSGPLVERFCFAGNLMRWLDGQVGRAAGGWFFLLLPLMAILVSLLFSRVVGPRLRLASAEWSYRRCAVADVSRFFAGGLLVVLLAAAGAYLLDIAGYDPRGGIFDTYVQRNALVVGLMMGFAIIPIIYTIAEDALSSVPEHLRSASLGAGATPWQTAMRIVVPTAMSGLFSAAMIGLGRAVGETMIVLMAAGNTPVMEWNIFNGFRTLSANIAVELPEAVRNSTHYRTLFLAALVLFIMTFILNTIAELIRIRFRKKAIEL